MQKKKNQEMAHLAGNRSIIYGLLAAIYRRELSSELLEQLKTPAFLNVLAELGINLNNGFFQNHGKVLLEEMAVEYARLFVGPGKHISPHESVHHKRDDGQNGQLWGLSTAEVKNFIESSGLKYESDYKGLPDHISVELEFMQQVIQREETAWIEKDDGIADLCLKNEKKFIEEHLARWIPDFCEKVIKEAYLPFYREMAKLTKTFIEFEAEEIRGHGDNSA